MREISRDEFVAEPFNKIDRQWMLVTAAKPDGSVNTMTASWGGLGTLWNKPVAFVFIRPQRYTKEFIDASDMLSLSFLPGTYRKQLSYLGSVSGRDEDKIARSGLTVAWTAAAATDASATAAASPSAATAAFADAPATPYFAEAEDVLIGRKLYAQELDPACFVDTGARSRWYADNDYHTVYVVGIEHILTSR